MTDEVQSSRAVVASPKDNVATLLADVPSSGARIVLVSRDRTVLGEVESESAIPFGHKIAIRPLGAGDPVVKFGTTIGEATRDIASGSHVHTHNVRSPRFGDLPDRGGG
jgi:altronate dehydratase small subunit